MNLYLLKNKFTYDEIEENIGIFDTKENMEQGKKDFMKTMPEIEKSHFHFSYEKFVLNKCQ
jgi:hypothetical protein